MKNENKNGTIKLIFIGSSILFYFPSQVSANGTTRSHNKTSEMSVEDVAMGFVRVANEAMCRPIRALTQVSCVIAVLI